MLIRCFLNEAIHRAAHEASTLDRSEVGAEELEKVLPQLLLDF